MTRGLDARSGEVLEKEGIPIAAERWSSETFDKWVTENRNWNRWGADDELGATNLIDDAKRLAAARLVKTGRSVSLGERLYSEPIRDDLIFVQHYYAVHPYAAVDFVVLPVHSNSNTHLDAFNHIWDKEGAWNGRDPKSIFEGNRAIWGDVDAWRDGIINRGVLIDIPGYRGKPYVTYGDPVTDEELEAIIKAQGVTLEPGDAICLYSGREAHVEDQGSWGVWETDAQYEDYVLPMIEEAGIPARPRVQGVRRHHHPGLDVSCLKFVREHDCAVVVWDMHDASEHDYSRPWTVHSIIWAFGVAVVDAARLDRLA
jgi:hypothetical protein